MSERIRELESKREKVKRFLADNDLDAVILSLRPNFSWYLCGAHNHVNSATQTGVASLVIGRDEHYLMTNTIEAPRMPAEEINWVKDMEIVEFPWHDADARAKAFEKILSGKKAAADTPVPGFNMPVLPESFSELRLVLSDTEMERYRLTGRRSAGAIEATCRSIDKGMTEHEVAGLTGVELHSRGLYPWVVLVAADDRIERFRHPIPTGKRVEKYCMVVICAEDSGLIVSCTRLVSFGPLSEALAKKHRAVCNVDAAFILSTRAGSTLGQVFKAGMEAYREQGFPDEWKLHHQGGLAGYQTREMVANPDHSAKIQANQAFAWNPSITGTKSEDTILLSQKGIEIISAAKDWPMMEWEYDGQTVSRPDILIM